MNFDELKKQVGGKINGKDSKKVITFLEKNQEIIETLGKDVFARGVAWMAQGEGEKAKDLFLIKYQAPEELIQGIADSSGVFKTEHEALETKAESINGMIKVLGEALARAILPIIITAL